LSHLEVAGLGHHEIAGYQVARPFPAEIELGDIELPAIGNISKPPGRRIKTPALFSWRFEFSWRTGLLFFDGEPLVVNEATKPLRRDSGTNSTLTAFSLKGNARPASEVTKISVTWEDTIERMVDFLDQYDWKTHRPQRLAKGAQRTTEGTNGFRRTGNTPYSRPGATLHSLKPAPSRRRKITHGSGDGDEDGDDDDKEPHNKKPQTKSEKTVRYLACPFRVWRHGLLSFHCFPKLTAIWQVKNHLMKSHRPSYCRSCLVSFPDETILAEHKNFKLCRPSSKTEGKPIRFMTDEQYWAINERAAKRRTVGDQWRDIFRRLFPEESTCPSPYLDEVIVETMKYMESIFLEARAELLGEFLGAIGSIDKTRHLAILECVFDKWLSRTLDRILQEKFDASPSWGSSGAAMGSHLDSFYPDPLIGADSTQNAISAPETTLGYLTENSTAARQSPITAPHSNLGSWAEAAASQASGMWYLAGDGGMNWEPNSLGLIHDPVQFPGGSNGNWHLPVGPSRFSAGNEGFFSQEQPASALFPTEQGADQCVQPVSTLHVVGQGAETLDAGGRVGEIWPLASMAGTFDAHESSGIVNEAMNWLGLDLPSN